MGLRTHFALLLTTAVFCLCCLTEIGVAGPYPSLWHSQSPGSCDEWCCDTLPLCESGCDQVFSDPGPTLSGRVKFIYMRRDGTSDPGILRNTANNQTTLKGNDFDFDFQPGIDASVTSHLGYGTELEARYMWVDDWNASVYVTNPTPGDLQFRSNPLSTGGITDDMYSKYSSRLQTAEVNLKQRSGDVTWLLGFRWAEIDEDMQINSVGNPIQTIGDFDTRNDLFGGQIGAEASLWTWGSWGLGGFAKTGIYANRAKGLSRLQVGNNILGTARDQRVEPAILSEAGLEGVYWVNESINLRIGYQVFIAHGIAVAAEQVKKTGNLNPGGTNNIVRLGLDTSSYLFAHGGTGALEIVW